MNRAQSFAYDAPSGGAHLDLAMPSFRTTRGALPEPGTRIHAVWCCIVEHPGLARTEIERITGMEKISPEIHRLKLRELVRKIPGRPCRWRAR